jgi:beta-N-acetylhexosaminidase
MGAPRAAIFGCLGPELTPRERAFFAEADPWGFILFARNVETPEQLRRLTGALRESVGREAPVLIDQEGGRVARLRGPHWREWPRVPDFCDRFAREAELLEALSLRYRIIAAELRDIGVDVNCAPLLDVAKPDADPIIADRALGGAAALVAARGRAVAEGLLAGGVLPVVKHIPGQGRATTDSHEALPVVDTPLAELEAEDFAAFAPLADLPMAMTAHVVYSAIDPDHCGTQSTAVIAAIRGTIGFRGLLMTDDLNMSALSGDHRARTRAALGAGCDVILHCNGEPEEMAAVVAEAPRLEGAALARADNALSWRRAPDAMTIAEAEGRLDALMGETAHA